jgi:hypothetical protein
MKTSIQLKKKIARRESQGACQDEPIGGKPSFVKQL